MNDLLGKDLRVLPFFSAHDTSALDLVSTERLANSKSAAAKDGSNTDLTTTDHTTTDIASFSGRENLAQALTLRLLTPKGSLKSLGHAAYGSRLHELVGRLKNDSNRNLCRLFVLQAVAQEPRVEDKAVTFSFDIKRETPSSFYFDLAVKPINSDEPLAISLELGL